MNLEFKCSADKVQAKAQNVLERYYGVLQSKRHMRQLRNNRIKTVEKMLNLAQCTDREKVLYALGRLEGTAADWWDAYTAAHDIPDTIN
jgi:hypothetical protein